MDKNTLKRLKLNSNSLRSQSLRSRTAAAALLISLGLLGRPQLLPTKDPGSTTGEFPVWKPDDSGEMAKLSALRSAPRRRLAFPPVRQRKPKPKPKPVETTTTTSTTEPPPAPAPDSSRAARFVAYAKRFLGVPYVYGGDDPSGFDCSGLTQYSARHSVGIELPRTSQAQATVGRRVYGLARARLGDLVFFNYPVTHVAIYIGNGLMIAAPHTGTVVRIQSVYETPSIIRRIL